MRKTEEPKQKKKKRKEKKRFEIFFVFIKGKRPGTVAAFLLVVVLISIGFPNSAWRAREIDVCTNGLFHSFHLFGFRFEKNVLEMFFFFFFYPVFIGVEFPTDTRKPLPCLFFFVKINNFFSKSFFFVSGSRSVEFVRPFRDEGLFFFSGFFSIFFFSLLLTKAECAIDVVRCLRFFVSSTFNATDSRPAIAV